MPLRDHHLPRASDPLAPSKGIALAVCALILALGLSPAPSLAQAQPAGANAAPAPLGAPSTAAPAAMLALRYDASIDPAAYWVSEKLDGVRALWDGQRLRFRSGREIVAPAWFIAALP